MKHGYYVMGVQDGIEFTFSKNSTRHQAKRTYERAMRLRHLSDKEKKTLRIVELVEKDITADLVK